MVASDFSSIPILNYSLLDMPSQQPKFNVKLQHALINIRFLYLSNHPVPTANVDSLIKCISKLPLASRSQRQDSDGKFRAFSGVFKVRGWVNQGEHWEQFNFSMRHVCRWKEGDPKYYCLYGPHRCVCLGWHANFGRFKEWKELGSWLQAVHHCLAQAHDCF